MDLPAQVPGKQREGTAFCDSGREAHSSALWCLSVTQAPWAAGEVATCFWGENVHRGMPSRSLAQLTLEHWSSHNQRTRDLCQVASLIYKKHLSSLPFPTLSSHFNTTLEGAGGWKQAGRWILEGVLWMHPLSATNSGYLGRKTGMQRHRVEMIQTGRTQLLSALTNLHESKEVRVLSLVGE